MAQQNEVSDGRAGRTTRRAGRHDVDSLLSVAVEVFTRRGFDGSSMEDIARAAGVSKSSIYHHVDGKEHLLRLALERAIGPLFGVLEEPAATQGRAVDRLEHVLRREVEILVAELPYVTLLLRVRGNSDTEAWALDKRREFDRHVVDLARRAVSDGDLRDDLDPHLVTRLVFGMINSIAEWYRPRGARGPGDRPTAARVADAVVAVALQGWSAGTSSS